MERNAGPKTELSTSLPWYIKYGIGEILRASKNRNTSHLKDVERKTSLIVDVSKTSGSEAGLLVS